MADAQSRFKIIFSIYPWHIDSNPAVLDSIKSWGGTGASLWLNWNDYQDTDNPFYIDTSRYDPEIDSIIADSLDVYLRVELMHLPGWVLKVARPCDELIDTTGKPVEFAGRIQLNFASDSSLTWMLRFYRALLKHLERKYGPSGHIIDITPSVSHDQEMEYPYDDMCSFDSTDIAMFQKYLSREYGTISALDTVWDASFSSFGKIDPIGYHWADTINSNDTLPRGRIDWIDFRTKVLRDFIDSCYTATHAAGFNMTLQLGSIYDNMIENRGWVDPTSLMQYADRIVVDDIYSYEPNFAFGANYLRSICLFWNVTDSNHTRVFSTETDWPGVYGAKPRLLCAAWADQLKQYYVNGASALSIVHWDTSFTNSNDTAYAAWKQTLLHYRNAPVLSVSYSKAVLLDCNRLARTHNFARANGIYKTFDIESSLEAKAPFDTTEAYRDGKYDIVTGCMLKEDPSYLARYMSAGSGR